MVMKKSRMGSKAAGQKKVQAAPTRERTILSYKPIRPAPNGPLITHFKPSNRGAQNNDQNINEEYTTDDFCIDKASVYKQFGWGLLGTDKHIPYIYRKDEKYCAVRMVDKYIFDNYLLKISDNIYFGCTNILGYYITIPEVMLLNEINEFHCDRYYGNLPFKQGDVLVKLDDAIQFYDFLTVCSNKLFNTPCDEKRCGFLTMNETSIVPYVIVNEKKCVPLFYFDGMEDIRFKSQTIKGWDLVYLKFCFKVHGIRDEFCKSEDCQVILLDDLTQYLDPGDSFKEWSPVLELSNRGIFQPRKVSNKNAVKAWHQPPMTIIPISVVKYSKFPNKSLPTSNYAADNSNVHNRTILHS